MLYKYNNYRRDVIVRFARAWREQRRTGFVFVALHLFAMFTSALPAVAERAACPPRAPRGAADAPKDAVIKQLTIGTQSN